MYLRVMRWEFWFEKLPLKRNFLDYHSCDYGTVLVVLGFKVLFNRVKRRSTQ